MSDELIITHNDYGAYLQISIKHPDILFSVSVIIPEGKPVELGWSQPNYYMNRRIEIVESDPDLIATLERTRIFREILDKAIEIASEYEK